MYARFSDEDKSSVLIAVSIVPANVSEGKNFQFITRHGIGDWKI